MGGKRRNKQQDDLIDNDDDFGDRKQKYVSMQNQAK